MGQITKSLIVMERRSRDSNNGTYYPSFFNIYIPTYEIPDMPTFANNSEQFKAYFLHEYIHFIQDLTTIPGLSNICVVVDYLKWTVKQGSNGIIKVPLVPIQRDGYRLLNNAELHRIREGHSTMKTKDGCNLSVSKIVKYYFSDDSYVDDKGTWKNLSCSVDFKDQNGKLRTYNIGEYAITECVAYNIEQYIYKNVLGEAYDFPYKIISLLLDKEIAGFSNDPLRLIALCDACLMYSFPGAVLCDAISMLKKTNDLSPENIYDTIVDSKELFNHYNGNSGFKNNDEILDYFSKEAQKQVSDYYKDFSYQDNYAYFLNTLFFGRGRKIANRYLFLDIARNGDISVNKTFQQLLFDFGCPLIINKEGHVINYIPSEIHEVDSCALCVINQVYKLMHKCSYLENGTIKCELVDQCRENKTYTELIDDNCYYSPWNHEYSDQRPCHFRKLWNAWGLSGVTPICEMKADGRE